MSVARKRVLVLGAGLQGVCVALGLARRGCAVTLIDQAADCMQRASLRNEGKIHLGFVYAHDPSFRTSSLMLRASLAFAPLIDEWIGHPLEWTGLSSRSFIYVIARDSMLPAADLFVHYERLQTAYRDLLDGDSKRATYLGRRPRVLWQELPPRDVPGLDDRFAAAAVATEELALDLVPFREALRNRLHALDRVERLYRHRIEGVCRAPAGFRVEGARHDGTPWSREGDAVVNCLWDGRLRIDQQMALLPRRPWMHRLKYRLLGHLPTELAHLSSLTLVLGCYGDLVVYPSGRAYLSWYPACMKGSSTEVNIPSSWEPSCNGEQNGETHRIASDALAGFASVVPGLEGMRVNLVDAGVIFAWGQTDIDDARSELHQRFEVGVHCLDGYYSVDTGKLTCAPLFARHVMDSLH